MPVTKSTIDWIANLAGLHLFHTDISNCCDRVRIALAEKGLSWENHFYVLPKGDHLTEEFFQLNPKGVVPVLVHDGKVITESKDIIEYLDEHFSEGLLRPTDAKATIALNALLDSAADFHIHIAALSFEFLFKAAPYSPEFFKRRAHFRKDSDTEPMRRIFDPQSHGVRPEAVKEALHQTRKTYEALNARLASAGPWLLGEQFTLADISWAVQIHRLKTTGLKEINNWPHLRAWYEAMEQRPSVQQGMLDWETPEPYALFAGYVKQRQEEDTDINAACWRD